MKIRASVAGWMLFSSIDFFCAGSVVSFSAEPANGEPAAKVIELDTQPPIHWSNAAPVPASAFLAVLPHGFAPAEPGAAVQLFARYVHEQTPGLVIANGVLHLVIMQGA